MTATQNNNTFSMRSTRDAIGFRERINTPVICKLLSSPTPRSKKQHRLRMNLRFGDIPIIEVCPTSLKTKRIAQLASDSKAESCEIAAALSDRICYSNFYDSASSLSCVTLPPLSSAANSSKNSFSLSSHRVRSIVTVTLTALMLLTSQLSSSSAARSSLAKVPLTRTDATSSERGYRTFIGQGSSSSPASRSSNAVQEPLDFQTMKVIKQWEGTTDILLISGRNYVYMIDASSPPTDLPIRYMGKLHWSSSYESQTHCQQMGKQQHECNNFIRVVEKEEDGRLFVCGTNSYEPVCRYYRKSDFFSPSSPSDIPCNRRCGCPHNPYTASASLYTNTSNGFQLFSAVIHDFLSKRPVLMRTDSPYVYSMDKWFNDPTFIKLVESKDGKVYLFFRETATAVETGTSSPTTYSRVAQVCKNDTGGTPTVLRFQWTSFLKARLKCAIPGSSGGQEFVFNNLTSVSDVTQMRGEDGQLMDVIFATFTTPWDWNAVEMSAVCVYSMRTIQNLFEVGNFLGEQELQSIPVNKELDPRSPIERIVKAVPVPDYKVPVPRPGKCSAQSEPINDKTLYFTKAHYLMYDPVQPLYEEPMFVSESDIRATQITVDTNAGYNGVLVVYVGTEDGRILRLRPRLQKQGQKSVLLEEIRVAEEKKCESGNNPCGVLALHVSRPSIRPLKVPKPSTFVAFTDRLVQVAFSNCQRYINSECCNVDPDCGWKIDKCVPRTALNTASLPRVGDLATVPTQCQTDPPLKGCKKQETSSRDCSKAKQGSKQQNVHGCPIRRTSPQQPMRDQDVVSISGRSVVGQSPGIDRFIQFKHKNSRSEPAVGISERSDSSDSTMIKKIDQPEDSDRGDYLSDANLVAINNLFMKVIDAVSEDYVATRESLPQDQRKAFEQQLRESLVETSRLIVRNHKNEYCLPTSSVNSIVHAYPVLLHEVELWHESAIKKMSATGIRKNCWKKSRNDPCVARISFSSPFPPTLWKPMTHLLKEFGATCDTATEFPKEVRSRPMSEDCEIVPGSLPCKNRDASTDPHCQPMQCRFSRYSTDVTAFFGHANDSRNFLSAKEGVLPLRKPVNVTVSDVEAVKGHLELYISEEQPFLIHYSPMTEKVKIMFYYSAIRDCSLNDESCTGNANGCKPNVEKNVTSWFSVIMNKLKRKTRKCNREIRRAKKDNRRRDAQLGRPRRSPVESNQIGDLETPKRCLYVKVQVPSVDQVLWDDMIARAQNRGGEISSLNDKITFYSRENIRLFFDNNCAITTRDEAHESLGKLIRKRKSSKKVEIIASRTMPFVIERKTALGKVKLKYFTNTAQEEAR